MSASILNNSAPEQLCQSNKTDTTYCAQARFTLTSQDKSDQLFVSVPGRRRHGGAGEQTGERCQLHPLLIE
jgi:hypothetical protein